MSLLRLSCALCEGRLWQRGAEAKMLKLGLTLAWFAQGVRHWLALRVFPLACERRACVGFFSAARPGAEGIGMSSNVAKLRCSP